MGKPNTNARNAALKEISQKINLIVGIITFVIVTLFAMIVKYLHAPVQSFLSFIPDISVTFIVATAFALALIGLYLAIKNSREAFRIILDYSTKLERLLGITKDLREEIHGDILLEKIMDYALEITRSDAGSLLLRDGNKLVFKIVRGSRAQTLLGSSIDTDKGLAGWVAEHGESVRLVDAEKDQRFNPEIDLLTGYKTKSVLCVPMKTGEGVVGVLELLNKQGGYAYRERDEEIIRYLADQAAISILKTKFVEDQKNYEIHLTDMLLEAIDYHIPEKQGHSRRVARYSNIIARGLNMDETQKKHLYFACLLHDVGFLKMSPDDFFKKENYLQHPVIGYEMINPITFYSNIAPFILHHHERFDGYGYPSKLKGEGIPLEARIIAIAEAFDAMVSPVSYRVPVNFEQAVEELKNKAGTQFDPELVFLFTDNIEPQHIKP